MGEKQGEMRCEVGGRASRAWQSSGPGPGPPRRPGARLPTDARHSPRLVNVGALVGGAGGRRLGERRRAEDALRPRVHGGLEEQRDT